MTVNVFGSVPVRYALPVFARSHSLFFITHSRLHENIKAEPHATFSAWKWLSQEQPETVDLLTQQQKQEDALYALGVAGLASKKLLQKHHLAGSEPREAIAALKSAALAASMPLDVESASATASTPAKQWIARAAGRVATTRRSLHEYQATKLKAAVVAAFAVLMRGPQNLVRSLWALSGGKENVTRTIIVAVALTVVLVRPLAHLVAEECLHMTRRA